MSHCKIILVAVAVIAAFIGAATAQIGDPANCGVSSKVSPRIVGGVPANTTSWPWIVALIKKTSVNSTSYYQFCGGSLITVRHVLSAAHCMKDLQPNLLRVQLGEYNLGAIDPQTISVGVSAIRVHEWYDSYRLINDIAILRLETRVTYNNYIRPICLPQLATNTYSNAVGWIAGWGTTVFGGQGSAILREASVRIWPQSECNNRSLSDTGILPVSNMCAGELVGGKSTCQGDSGGPLMVQRSTDGKWEKVGITSWGIGCARPRSPSVYTRVTSYLLWIALKTTDI